SFDPSIPTLEAVLGYKSGERISSPADALTYFRALAEAAPDRMRIVEYARSWENRRLVYGIIASKENLARTDDIKASIAQISDPRVIDNPAAEQLIADLPATAWMSYTVHGNELSGTDAALVLAYHLLAAQGSPDVDAILENTLTFIDPTQNPDGRNRFVHNYITTAGIEPSSNQIAAERNEPWPGGRTNHYLFDMNRDWVAQTQPESKGRVRALLEWRPLVVVDAHEMGTDQTYYFPPEADPINPYITQEQMELADLFGKNNAKAFDDAGLDYYTRDIFDKLFPGYGDSWPSFYGAVAMTFEQASARGMIARKSSGEVFTYRDSVFGQVTASFATLKTAADNREALWQNYWGHGQTGLAFGETQKTKAYVIPSAPRANALAEAIFDQGLELHTADGAFEACGGSYDAGTFVTSLSQPRSRFVKTLMDPTSPMTEDFLGEQERRRANGEREELYDVTAWSLPLSFGVDVKACRNDPTTNKKSSFSLITEFPTGTGEIEGPRSAVGYAIDWSADGVIAFLGAALRDDLKARSSDGA
ncbi:MAG: M14 metallopeptidase family protein, partial [Pseudomonadota bacterium]